MISYTMNIPPSCSIQTIRIESKKATSVHMPNFYSIKKNIKIVNNKNVNNINKLKNVKK